jgi:hypothetical protein
MEEKEKYGIKDKSCNNSSIKEADTLNFIRCFNLISMHENIKHKYGENRIGLNT